FAGGRRPALLDLGASYSVSLWFWNGLVTEARPVTGYLFSRGRNHAVGAPGDHVGLEGHRNPDAQGRLFFYNGEEKDRTLHGRTPLERWTWNHLVLVRDGDRVKLYLNGRLEIEGAAARTIPTGVGQCFIGGRNDNVANFEGRIDEVAFFNRALTAEEVGTLGVD
ncbi:MAG: LamG domain-containing protein, partial [Verrucomicrobiota bacterium]